MSSRAVLISLMCVGFLFASWTNVRAEAQVEPIHLTQNHQLWDRDEDIRVLQQVLNARAFTVALSGPGAPGFETTLFGPLTYRALVNFQAANLLPATGFLGPLTRALLALTSTVPDPSTPGTSAVSPVQPDLATITPLIRGSGGSGSRHHGTSSDDTTPTDVIAPAVSLTAPLDGATLSGSSVSLTAAATDDVAIAGVQFRIAGANAGSEDFSSPYAYIWNTTLVSDGTYRLAAVARDTSNNYATSTVATVTVDNTGPVRSGGSPTGVLAYGTNSTTLTATTNEAATCHYSTSSGTAYSSGVAFDTTGATSHSTAIAGLQNSISYTYFIRCQDELGNANTDDFSVSFSVAADTTSPTVSLTAPLSGDTVSGSSVALAATASDDVSVSGVTFKVDGATIGTEDTAPAYVGNWDSTSLADGSHTLSAVARDGSGNLATSSISVTVDNTGPVSSSISSGTPASTAATITWSTNEPATSRVVYGVTTAYGLASSSASLDSFHSIRLTGLNPSTTYHYVVVSTDASGNTATSSDRTLVTAVAPDVTAPVLSAISVATTTTTATITWTTDESSDSKVVYGATSGYGLASTSVATTTSHSITLTGLTAGATYHYAVVSADAVGNAATSSDGSFVTASAPSALIYSQNFDGVTAPALPSGWTFTPASPAKITTTAWSSSGANALSMPIDQAAADYAVYNLADTNNGDVIVSTMIQFNSLTGFNKGGVFARGGGSTSTISTSYQLIAERSGTSPNPGLYLYVGNPNSPTQIANITSGSIFTNGVPYYLELKCLGASISGRVRRGTDGYWLNSSGTWTATESTAFSVTDSTLSSAGYFGLQKYSGTSAGAVYFDDVVVSKASLPEAQTFAITPDSSPTATAGLANHRGAALLLKTDGSLAAPLTMSLSDNGAGGRFVTGPTPAIPSSAFNEVASVTLVANSAFANATVWYLPAYNRSSPVTITASSSLGSKNTTYSITSYSTTASPTATSLSFDTVAVRAFDSMWTALPLDKSGGFVSGLAGYTNLLDVGGGTETISGGNYSRLNSVTNTVWYRGNSTLAVNSYQVSLKINAWGGGATDQATIGYAVDANNYLYLKADNNAGTITIGDVKAGVPAHTATFSVSLPAGSQVALRMGGYSVGKLFAFYMRPGDADWTAVGTANPTGDYDLIQTATVQTLYPFWGTSQSANTALQVTNFTAGLPGYKGGLNISVVKDVTTGAPLLNSSGDSIYLAVGLQTSNSSSDTSVGIFTLNTRTYAIIEVGRVFLGLGTALNVGNPAVVAYNPNTSSWIVMSADWTHWGSSIIIPYYSTTTQNLLTGVHSLSMTALALPGTSAAGAGTPTTVYDADILLSGSTYYISYLQTDGAASWTKRWVALASSTSLGGTFTNIWEASHTNTQDGSRISQVGGSKVVLAAQNSAQAYNFTTGALLGNLSNVTLDGPAGNGLVDSTVSVASHPSLAPIPGEVAGQTRYLIAGFAQYTASAFSGILPSSSYLVVLEALQRYTANEYSWITAP